jgi:uncharacterized membrane protein YhiD involved in acid resistance
VVRFRNAVKETRDVGFIFLAMAIGMACGARFYTLAAVGAVVICAVVLVMSKFDWFALDVQRQVVKVQVPAGENHTPAISDVLNTPRSSSWSARRRSGAVRSTRCSTRCA